MKSEFESAMSGAPFSWPGTDGFMNLMLKARTGGPNSNFAYMVCEIFPSDTDTKQLFSDAHVGPVSKWSVNFILDEYDKQEKLKRPTLASRSLEYNSRSRNSMTFSGASGSSR